MDKYSVPESIIALTGKWCLLFPHFERAIKSWKRCHYVMNNGKMKCWKWRITFLPLSRPLLCSEYHTLDVTEATAPVIFSPAAEWTMGRTVTETLSELRWPAVSVTVSWKMYPPSWTWDSFSVPGCGTWGKAHSKKNILVQWIYPWSSRNKELIMEIKYFLQSSQPIQACISAWNIWSLFFFFLHSFVKKPTTFR